MKDDLIDITIVLDRSGSMEAVREDTIGGFDAFLEEQKAVPGDASLTLVQFDDKYEVLYEGKRLQDAPALSTRTFVPRGSTALLDAIGRAVNATGARLAAQRESERAGKVLFVIMTDGEENASREFSSRQVFDMITHQREKYQWEVVFIGANQDAVATGASYGIPKANALNYAATPAGTRGANATLSKATASFRRRSVSQSAEFFEPEDQK